MNGKVDDWLGLENMIVGHLIPAGTGLREYDRLIVGSQEEYDLPDGFQTRRRSIHRYLQS